MCNNKSSMFLAVLAVLFAPLSAFATADVTGITAVGTDVGLIGAAVFGVFVAIKAVKLVRRAL